MIKFYIITLILLLSNLASTANKNSTDLKSMKKMDKEESLDLSSELKQSLKEGKAIGTVATPPIAKPVKKKKTKKILRVEAGPNETVQVPDNMEWDHNKKTQDAKIRKLRKELDGEMTQDKGE